MSNHAASGVSALDVLRGLIIIPMAPDHIRDFFAATLFAPKDISQTTTAWFITQFGGTLIGVPVNIFLIFSKLNLLKV